LIDVSTPRSAERRRAVSRRSSSRCRWGTSACCVTLRSRRRHDPERVQPLRARKHSPPLTQRLARESSIPSSHPPCGAPRRRRRRLGMRGWTKRKNPDWPLYQAEREAAIRDRQRRVRVG
jgi:hypothetical protein